MWGWILGGGAALAWAGYELLKSPKPQSPPLNVKPPPKKMPPPGVLPAPSQGTSTPHTVPGGAFVYTGAQAPQAQVQAAATALAAVDPTLKANEQLVRNFQDAAGLAQRPGGAGWDQVSPTGTDGRYGHDVSAVLGKYVPNAPPASATRPPWWGPPGAYYNN